MAKIRRNEGDVLLINLGDEMYAFGRVLQSPLMAFYAVKAEKDTPFEIVSSSDVAFSVWVMKHAITSGRWPKVGNYPLESKLNVPPVFFRQDALNGKIFKYYSDGTESPATREECAHLECAAVWDPEHIEDRLRDFFVGRPNKWVESMKIK